MAELGFHILVPSFLFLCRNISGWAENSLLKMSQFGGDQVSQDVMFIRLASCLLATVHPWTSASADALTAPQ